MNSKPKILVTGSNGQLGKELQLLAPSFPQYDFIFLSREDLPLQNFELVRNTFRLHNPQYLINCAAREVPGKFLITSLSIGYPGALPVL